MNHLPDNYKWEAADNRDSLQIQHLVFSVLREYGLEPGAIDFCLKDIDLHYFKKGGFFGILMDENNEIVATAGLYPIGNNSAEIRKMYLHKDHRGKGLGKFILKEMINKAMELNFNRLELETASVLKEAISLYKKHGFRPFISSHISPRCDQAYELFLKY
jgi:GNAT superfamily N-acetyltransferase